MKTLTLPAIELRQNGTRLLISKMRAGDLATYTRIDPFDTNKAFDDPRQGYQRPEEGARVKKLSNWMRRELEEGHSVRMPTALLLSSRGSDVVLSQNGTITLKESSKLPLIDGQHRRRGFEWAIAEKGLTQLSDFELPIVIIQDIDLVGEMNQFRIVNGEQKSVRTDLVNMILTQLVAREGDSAVAEKDEWKVVASLVVKRLNADKDGPWYDRIVMPDKRAYSKEEVDSNPALQHLRTARATSFISALKSIDGFLGQLRPGSASLDERADELFKVIDGYWRALRSMIPICFDEADDYVLLKTPGIFALHRLCLSVMKDMYRGHRDFVEKEFSLMLGEVSELHNPAFWCVGSSEADRGDAAKYGSMKGFSELGDLLYESSRP
jgi:DGQHR domain-containing protein